MYDAYTQFEEGVVMSAMQKVDEDEDDAEQAEELELRLAFLEHLTVRPPAINTQYPGSQFLRCRCLAHFLIPH